MKGVVYILYRFLPIFMMLAISPNSEKKLENLSSFLAAAKDSIEIISNSLETFHANAVPLMMNLAVNSGTASQPQTSQNNGEQS
jgi:hypothetical protein